MGRGSLGFKRAVMNDKTPTKGGNPRHGKLLNRITTPNAQVSQWYEGSTVAPPFRCMRGPGTRNVVGNSSGVRTRPVTLRRVCQLTIYPGVVAPFCEG